MSARQGEGEPISAEDIRAAFDAAAAYTVGIEDEVMLLDPETLELCPRAPEAIELLGEDDRYKLELPAAQLEIVTPPQSTVAQAAECLHLARVELAERVAPLGRPAAAGAHPFSDGRGELNQLERYRHTLEEYGPIAQRQLVCALQVHVAVGGADLALAAYNSARPYLPLLAALAANAPFYEGRDTGLASVRSKLCDLLPRQGLPPAIVSWEQLAEDLRWGQAAGTFAPGAWWWELRPHRRYGTLEFRVPDAQSSVSDAAAIAAVVQSLVAWLAERARAGEVPSDPAIWRIAENRWLACRYGVQGKLADLQTGARRPTRDLLHELLDELEPLANRLKCAAELGAARRLIERNGAIAQREVASEAGLSGLGQWLCRRFLEPPTG